MTSVSLSTRIEVEMMSNRDRDQATVQVDCVPCGNL